MFTVDVIIPSKTALEYETMTSDCISSLRASEKNIAFNVVIIESEAPHAAKYVGQDHTIYWKRDAFNYHGALNLGIKATQNEWVVLANNDLIFHPGWFSEIVRVHGLHPHIHSFSSWTSYWQWHEQAFAADLDRVKKADAVLGYRAIDELAGWCLTVRRELLNRLNLRETVDFYYSDRIYADELLKIDMKHALVVKSRVDHVAHVTLRHQDGCKELGNEGQLAKYLKYQTEEERVNPPRPKGRGFH